ncbi:Protein FMO-1 [Aphelenchoides avenae]|nr:Protein FMO-1 [Aphelenchus avenae]
MKSTIINTSKEMTAYSDFPPPADFANFMHNTQLLKYFEMYAEHNDLHRYIRFRHTVTNVRRADDYEDTGRWVVEYNDAHNNHAEETFDAVLAATGHHAEPSMPSPPYPGQEKFRGKIIHSHSYKDHKGYEDSNVVVVGIGNSAVDVAVELSRIAKQVYLSTRRGAWVYNRVGDYGEPADLQRVTRWNQSIRNRYLPPGLSHRITVSRLNQRFDHANYGVAPKHSIWSQLPTTSDELPNRIISGTVLVKPNIRAFTETGVMWEDGTVTEQVDHVVMSTGYLFGFPLIEGGKLVPVVRNQVDLYKYMYPPELSKHNSFVVIGLLQPLGSVVPLSEMQARLFFHVLTGHAKLPDRETMEFETEYKRKEMAKRYVDSMRYTLQVDYTPFMDELADIIGCKPNSIDYLLSDPVLAYRLLFGANLAYAYRLKGPHKWDGARGAIMTLNDRVVQATRTRDCGLLKDDFSYATYLVAIAVFVGLLFMIFV